MASPERPQRAQVGCQRSSSAHRTRHPRFPEATRKGKPGESYTCLTILGWVLNSPIGLDKAATSSSHFVKLNGDIERQLESMWKLEDGDGGHGLGLSESDRKVLNIWNNSVKLVDHHYTMDIPFKARPPDLPDNRLMAEHQLRLLGKRLQMGFAAVRKVYRKHARTPGKEVRRGCE